MDYFHKLNLFHGILAKLYSPPNSHHKGRFTTKSVPILHDRFPIVYPIHISQSTTLLTSLFLLVFVTDDLISKCSSLSCISLIPLVQKHLIYYI